MDVSEQAPVAIYAIELRVGLELDPRARAGEADELAGRAVALLACFRSVDLDETNARSSTDDEGVTVDDPSTVAAVVREKSPDAALATAGTTSRTRAPSSRMIRTDMSFADDGTDESRRR